jgi:hypothetical protein
MEWLATLGTGIVLLVLLAPLLTLAVTLFVLVPLAHLHAAPSMLGRASFTCPVSRRDVNATFETEPGFLHPSDVVACSLFGDQPVRCAKGCLAHADAHEAPPFMFARYALLSGDEALREPIPVNGARG